MSNLITHPYRKMKAADIPDEIVLAFIYDKGLDERVGAHDVRKYLYVYPHPMVFRKLQKLQRRGFLVEDGFGNWSLTDYGFHTINKMCGGFTRLDKEGQ